MSMTVPATLGSDPLAVGPGIGDAARMTRAERAVPAVLPAAVILPRAASWLNPAPASGSASAEPEPLPSPVAQVV